MNPGLALIAAGLMCGAAQIYAALAPEKRDAAPVAKAEYVRVIELRPGLPPVEYLEIARPVGASSLDAFGGTP